MMDFSDPEMDEDERYEEMEKSIPIIDIEKYKRESGEGF